LWELDDRLVVLRLAVGKMAGRVIDWIREAAEVERAATCLKMRGLGEVCLPKKAKATERQALSL